MWKVMIADDENYMLEAMENLIDWKKMECQLVYKAKNGQVLLEQVKKNPPDIIITDSKTDYGTDGTGAFQSEC